MGFIDPMVMGNAAATGSLELGSGPTIWFLIVGLLVASGTAILLSALRRDRIARFNLPRLAHAQLVAVSVGRVK
jgi:hypothetical protein